KPERLAQPTLWRLRLHLRREVFRPRLSRVSSRSRFFCLRDFGRFPLRRQLSLLSPANGRARKSPRHGLHSLLATLCHLAATASLIIVVGSQTQRMPAPAKRSRSPCSLPISWLVSTCSDLSFVSC